MNNPTDLIKLYVLLSHEKLQRSTISQRHRPVEASLRNRLLVWRFLKKIENEPIITSDTVEDFAVTHQFDNQLANSDPWILDLNTEYNDIDELDMDIESDLVNEIDSNEMNDHSPCDLMTMDQSTDMTLFLKRAIGAERRQKSSSDSFHFNQSDSRPSYQTSEISAYEETDRFFQDLCADLASTTATLVSSSTTNVFNFSATPEQTLIH